MGFQKVYQILLDNVTFATYGDRFRIAPEGVLGGAPGAKAETFVERGGQVIQLESNSNLHYRRGSAGCKDWRRGIWPTPREKHLVERK